MSPVGDMRKASPKDWGNGPKAWANKLRMPLGHRGFGRQEAKEVREVHQPSWVVDSARQPRGAAALRFLPNS